MRRAWILGTAVLFSSVAVLPATAQTVTSVNPPVLGQSISRSVARINFDDPYAPGVSTISDGLAVTIDGTYYGRGSRTYEFDLGGGLNIPGAIAVVPASADVYDAGIALMNALNSDATAPVTAEYYYADLGINSGWFTIVWKYDNEWRLTAGGGLSLTEAADPGNDISVSDFSTTNTDTSPVYLQLVGTDLDLLNNTTSVKLRHDANTTEVYSGVLNYKYTTNAAAYFRLQSGTGSPPTHASLGQYDLEINGSIVIDKAVTLVKNLLDDQQFRTHGTGSEFPIYWNMDGLLGPYWQRTKPYPNPDGVKQGHHFYEVCPRLYPFPTAANVQNPATNKAPDNEYGSLQWDTNDGVHKLWQSVYVNFASDTTLKLTGVWSANSEHYPMTFGAQLRSGDQNGTIIAETPPGQRVVNTFDWTDFAVSGRFPAGTTQVTVVFYAEQPSTLKKGLNIDNVLLQVDDDHASPPYVTGMTTDPYAATNDTNVTVTLTGVNLASGQTTVWLQQPDILVRDATWHLVGKDLQRDNGFTQYKYTPGDKIVLTGRAAVNLGEYAIESKDSDDVIGIVDDIGAAEGASVIGYIVNAPLAATTVNATGSQVEATFDLTGAPAGYRNIVVQVGTHDPIVWREGFNVVHPGPDLVNGSFELPEADDPLCGTPDRHETHFPALTDWEVRYWGEYQQDYHAPDVPPFDMFRDDIMASIPLCPAPELGLHYHSAIQYGSYKGIAQYYQTVAAEPGRKYVLSGYFAHGGQYGAWNSVTLQLLDGDSAAAPMTGASQTVFDSSGDQDWTFASVQGTATSGIITVSWEVAAQVAGVQAAWTDHLVLAKTCYSPFADTDADGDVDQADFSVFQLCYTGEGGTIPLEPAYCDCFDVDGPGGMPDGDIDQADLGHFEACASGPGIPDDPACDD